MKLVHELLSQTLFKLHDLLVKGQRSLVLPIAQVRLHGFHLHTCLLLATNLATSRAYIVLLIVFCVHLHN